MSSRLSFAVRATHCSNPTARKLFQLMAEKASNLVLSVDISQQAVLLELIDQVGSEICLLKTHVDIISDFDSILIRSLQSLADKHGFLLFEDRKFVDIGYTAQQQYGGGLYRIVEWADIINAVPIAGATLIQALRGVGLSRGRGLLLVAQMSSENHLAYGHYTQACIQMAEQYSDFVIGFITQNRLLAHPAFLHFTPGVKSFGEAKDALGQKYTHPRQAIVEQGSDIIIVGRGIYAAPNPRQAACYYRKLAWKAYTDCC